MLTVQQIIRQWQLLGVRVCDFCKFPLCDEVEDHRCLADQNGCGCGEECSLKENKCGCIQCWE